jgi:hypothetical protein
LVKTRMARRGLSTFHEKHSPASPVAARSAASALS